MTDPVEQKTDSFYPAMRLLLPHLERERAAYGIKEFMLAKLYIEILCLSKDSDDAQKLLNYRFSRNTKTEAGDFANVAYHVLSLRCPEKGTLSIEEVNNCLDSIATNNALKNKDEMKKSILRLLRNTSAREQKWLIRMIMKDLKMGISENTVFAAYHPDAKDLFDVTSSLSKVCSMLKNPNIRLNEIEISLFNPFRPMLAEYAPPKQIEKLMNNQAFHIETKYDGERIQLHKEGNKYMYFSRNCIDFTDYYGSTSFKGSFTPFIDRAFSSKVKNCILDGEIVGYNTKLNCIGSKGENFDVKNLHPGDIYQQCIIIFDILFYNDKVLTNYPLSERLQYLENLFTPIEGRIQCSPVKHASTEKEVVDALNEAIDNREEGIMIKDMSSVYYPNSRKRGWVKVKPEYVNNLTDELDLLIIGGYFGEGRRGGLISHFLLGVCANDKNDENPVFYSFTKVGSGYSYKELCDLLTKLNTNWNIYDKKNPPSNIILAPGHKEKPDVWIKPENSAVLQVKAAEITQSDQFKTGCSLRFPRVEKIRYDKSWNQCLTLSELENLRKEGGGKLAGRYCTITTDQNYEISPKKRKVILTSVKPTVAPHFQPADISDIKVKSHMFEEKEFCVINGPPSHSKHTLEKLIAEYGGNITQNPGMNTFCVIVDKVTLKAKNIIAKKQYNVVKVTWLLKCIDQNSFIPWKPYDLLSSSYSTSERFSEDFDKYGDSYTNNITEFELKEIFQQISEEECKEQCSNEEIAEKELKYFPNESLHGLFRIFRIYIDDKAILGEENTKIKSHSLGITELQLRLYGATIISKVDENTTHVITYSGDSSRYKMLRQMNRTRQKMFHLVTEDWVRECIKNKRLLNERHYQPNL
ncbi:DNA ligase 4-like isoform X3 [Centruroides sculpturatus]|uniref:DNA ligase 4-like isoform X3 n=1 Tax=Centruroides sculpturatus TaxID=218467 RepID=UPI000C6DF364|nr:DNA ligase 4-like isoform X3 [Centruroides sculpturatus]